MQAFVVADVQAVGHRVVVENRSRLVVVQLLGVGGHHDSRSAGAEAGHFETQVGEVEADSMGDGGHIEPGDTPEGDRC